MGEVQAAGLGAVVGNAAGDDGDAFDEAIVFQTKATPSPGRVPGDEVVNQGQCVGINDGIGPAHSGDDQTGGKVQIAGLGVILIQAGQGQVISACRHDNRVLIHPAVGRAGVYGGIGVGGDNCLPQGAIAVGVDLISGGIGCCNYCCRMELTSFPSLIFERSADKSH